MIRAKRSSHSLWISAWFLIVFVAWQSAAVASEPKLPDPGTPQMTRDEQEKLGLQVAAEVYKQMPVLPDSNPLTQYIQSLGTRLAATIPPEHSWPFQFHVVEQKEINAFALPGGPMFVNIGTITAADNEAELAGVMAHEIAHVYMQHSAKQQTKGSLLEGLAGIAGAIMGQVGGTWGNLAKMGIQFGAGTLMLKYSRSDEAQADAVGAIILWKAGYNPMALAEFFDKLAAKGGSGPQFLSDHPNPGNRRAAIQQEIREWPTRKYLSDSADFVTNRKRAESVKTYTAEEIAAGAKSGKWETENRKNGAVFAGDASEASASSRGGTAGAASVARVSITEVQPSSVFRLADLGALNLERPENWEVTTDRQSSSATIAPSAGVSGDAVAYGVVIRLVQTPERNMSVSQITAAIVKSLEGGDSNMKQSGEVRTVRVDGFAGGSVELETISPMVDAAGNRQRERDWLVAVPFGSQQAIFMVFVSPTAHFEQLRPTFERMLRSVQFW
jgi:predicted Zn-dependent protease